MTYFEFLTAKKYLYAIWIRTGAGKTTLLNFLSGREISQNLDKQGSIKVNGVEKDQIRNFSSYSAYV